jgi:hypothetical protein
LPFPLPFFSKRKVILVAFFLGSFALFFSTKVYKYGEFQTETEKEVFQLRRGILVVTLVLILFSGSYYLSLASAPAYTYEAKQVTMSTIGQPWTMQALTNDPTVKQVVFTWYYPYPSGSAVRTQVVTGNSPFEDTLVPEQTGWWGIVVDFRDANGVFVSSTTHMEDVGPYEIGPPENLVPEVPLLGTVGVAVAMLLGFAYFKRRQK